MTVSAPPWTLPMIAVPDFVSRTDASAAAEGVIAAVARAEGVRDIEELIAAGRKMDAVYKAIEVYGIDISHVKRLSYDPELVGANGKAVGDVVIIGDGAFGSAAELGAVLSHEIEVHIEQHRNAGDVEAGSLRKAVWQVEAYDRELVDAERFGLSKDEVDWIKVKRSRFYRKLDADYKKRVDEGIYDLKPGDEDK